MSNSDLSLLLVDDAKFSLALLERLLVKAGYQNLRCAQNAEQALQQHCQQPANIIIADWMMPDISGLELTLQIRQRDQQIGHYSYIILLTGNEQKSALTRAFEQGIDDFINKDDLGEQLLPRILAAVRLCTTLRNLMQEKHQLNRELTRLELQNPIDTLTGLGNLRHLRQRLLDALKLIESRGGVLCYLLLNVNATTPANAHIGQDLQRGLALRLQQNVRPLDELFRLSDEHFAALFMFNTLDECTPNSFQHLAQINAKPLETRTGPLPIHLDIVTVCLDAQALPTDPLSIMAHALKLVPAAQRSGQIVPLHLAAQQSHP